MNAVDISHHLHKQLREAVRQHRASAHRVAALLAQMDRGRYFQRLGFATLQKYAT